MAYIGFDKMTITRKNLFSYQKITGILTSETMTADNLKIEIPINKIKSAPYNKVNKVNKLVTVFAFAPAIKTNYNCRYRDRARTRLNHCSTVINTQPPIKPVPRNTYSSIKFLP
jgi:hypothetical protein